MRKKRSTDRYFRQITFFESNFNVPTTNKNTVLNYQNSISPAFDIFADELGKNIGLFVVDDLYGTKNEKYQQKTYGNGKRLSQRVIFFFSRKINKTNLRTQQVGNNVCRHQLPEKHQPLISFRENWGAKEQHFPLFYDFTRYKI